MKTHKITLGLSKTLQITYDWANEQKVLLQLNNGRHVDDQRSLKQRRSLWK